MKSLFSVAFFLSFLTASLLFADDGVCKKCQIIREYNETHPQKAYECYEDYLEEKGLNKDLTSQDKEKKAIEESDAKPD